MKRAFKWMGIALGTLVVAVLLIVFGVSEYRLRQTFDIAATPIDVPTDSASLERGRHVFLTRGCPGCHGQDTEGKVFFDEPRIARLVAPNVPKAIAATRIRSSRGCSVMASGRTDVVSP